jgi:hypothetical protein
VNAPGPWCPTCELFPGMAHPHEWRDRETYAPYVATVVQQKPRRRKEAATAAPAVVHHAA